MNNLNRYLFAVLVSGYLIKLGITGAGLADALVLLVMAGLHGVLSVYAENNKITQLKQEVKALEGRLDASDKTNKEIYAELKKLSEDTRNAVAGIKMGAGFKSVK